MANHRKKTSRKRGRSDSFSVEAAIAGGERAAIAVVAFRRKQARARKSMQKTLLGYQPSGLPSDLIPPRTKAFLGPGPTSGALIAEGDSWFDYPMQDVLRILEDRYSFGVESVAHKGDCVEDMAHTLGQFEEFARRLEKLLRKSIVPRAILLSGGGNDIAGDELSILLNHANSSLPAINQDIVRGVIDVRLREAYLRMIGGITAITRDYLDHDIPILVHGYDYPVPDGRGFLGGFWLLPGPWLQPGFRKKGHESQTANTELIAELIDRFNAMLQEVASDPRFPHVHYLDLRGTLKRDRSYKRFWDNELHPSEHGFGLVTERFARLIASL